MKNVFVFLCLLVLTACSREPAKLSSKSKTSGQNDVLADDSGENTVSFNSQAKTYIVKAESAKVIETKRGSRISIPAKAFVDQNGKPVRGKVTLNFSEYLSNGEVIASNIPMVYTNPKGKKEQFESAGMFEIRAFQKNDELKLAPGKSIEVTLASTNPGKFNFYAFDEGKNNWDLKDTDCLPDSNKLKPELAQRLNDLTLNPPVKPKKPIAYKAGDELFDIDVNPNTFPEFKSINGVMWKYLGSDTKKSPAQNPKWFAKKYKYVMMEELPGEDLAYTVTFMTKDDTLKFPAAPVFQGKLLTRKSAEFASTMQVFNETIAEAKQLRLQAASEDKLLRTFKIDALGIYNYDRQFKDEQAIPILASFEFGSEISDEQKKYMNVYLVPAQKNVVIKYSKESFKSFAINPNENNKLIAITSQNDMFYLSNSDIQKMGINASMKGKAVTFKLRSFKQKANDSKPIDDLLAKL